MSDVFTAAPLELGPNGEAVVTWFMETYGVERDAAIGSLVLFTKGQGQPPKELFVRFPILAVAYYTAIGKAEEAEAASKPLPEVDEPVTVENESGESSAASTET